MLERRSKDMKDKSLIVFFILFSFCFGTILSGCNNNSSVSVPITEKAVTLKKTVKKKFSESLTSQPPKQKKQKVHPQPIKPAKLKVQDKSKLKKISYKSNITGLRDPFVPFIKFTEKSAKQKVKKPLLPLQRYALSQLTLIAIIDAGKRGRWAMVQDASGKGYTVKKGMAIGSEGGTVKEVLPDQLIVEQTKVDLLGKKRVRLIALKLHPETKGE
jgi:type IV pilus assembly protein PilP